MTEVDIAVTIAPENELSQSTIKDLIKFQDSIEIIELRIDQWVDFDVKHVSKVVDNIYSLNLGKKYSLLIVLLHKVETVRYHKKHI